jgi:hypothetical protein
VHGTDPHDPNQYMASAWGFPSEEGKTLAALLKQAGYQAIRSIPEACLPELRGRRAKISSALVKKPSSFTLFDGFHEVQSNFSVAANIIVRGGAPGANWSAHCRLSCRGLW